MLLISTLMMPMPMYWVMPMNCCQFSTTASESFSILNHCM